MLIVCGLFIVIRDILCLQYHSYVLHKSESEVYQRWVDYKSITLVELFYSDMWTNKIKETLRS